MNAPKWQPEKPVGKVSEGINPAIVLGLGAAAAIAFVVAAVLLVRTLLKTDSTLGAKDRSQATAAISSAPPSQPRASSAVSSSAAPSSAVPASSGLASTGARSFRPTAAPNIAPSAAAPADAPAGLPPIRGYVLFGPKTFTVAAAEAHLAADRQKLVLMLYSGPDREHPLLSLVAEFKPGSTRCDEDSLSRYKVFLDLPISPAGKGGFKAKVVREPGPNLFTEIINLACTRAPGGEITIDIVGTDESTTAKTGWILNYGFVVKTRLR